MFALQMPWYTVSHGSEKVLVTLNLMDSREGRSSRGGSLHTVRSTVWLILLLLLTLISKERSQRDSIGDEGRC